LFPVEPLLQDCAQSPLGKLVDQPVLLGEGYEVRRLYVAELSVLPANQRLDLLKAAVLDRHLGLVDHVQLLPVERSLKSVDQLQLELRAHSTNAALSLASNSS